MKFKTFEKKIDITITEMELRSYINALREILNLDRDKLISTPIKNAIVVIDKMVIDFNKILVDVRDF